jgi:hypothetical protein
VLISELSELLEATLQRNTEANSVYRKVYLFEEYNRQKKAARFDVRIPRNAWLVNI